MPVACKNNDCRNKNRTCYRIIQPYQEKFHWNLYFAESRFTTFTFCLLLYCQFLNGSGGLSIHSWEIEVRKYLNGESEHFARPPIKSCIYMYIHPVGQHSKICWCGQVAGQCKKIIDLISAFCNITVTALACQHDWRINKHQTISVS